MENFDLRKYLAENRLLKEDIDEGRMKDPSRSIKMGKYPQVSSDTPVPMNVKYLTTNGEKLTMKVQAKNRKEAVDAVKSKDSNFKAEIKTDFVYDKDGNKLLKEDISSKAISVLKSYEGEVEGVEGYIKYLMNTSDDISSSIQAIADDLDRDKPSSDSLRRDLEKLSLAEGKLLKENE